MGYNDTENTYITSWNNVAFKVKDEARTLLNPEYLGYISIVQNGIEKPIITLGVVPPLYFRGIPLEICR